MAAGTPPSIPPEAPKRSAADPTFDAARELEEESRTFRLASLGSARNPRATFRTPRRLGESTRPPVTGGGSGWIFILLGLGALVLVLAVVNALFGRTPAPDVPERTRPPLATTNTSCEITPSGALSARTTIVQNGEQAVADRVGEDGIRLTWRGRADDTFTFVRQLPPTDDRTIEFVDVLLPPGSFTETPEGLRCGVKVELP